MVDYVAIIPTIDPSANLVFLIEDLGRCGIDRIVVVDDGSTEASRFLFQLAKEKGAVVVHHGTNRGKGAAIKTGLSFVRRTMPHAMGCVTVDDDGQHRPEDVRAVVDAALREPGALVLGTRNLHAAGVPLRSRLGNGFSSLYFKFDTGKTCRDTQTGLRAIPRNLWGLALATQGERYDYEMNFLTAAAKGGVPLRMVGIQTVYIDDNRASHFDTVRDSYRIYRSFFRFALSSLSCAGVDLGLFTLLTSILGLETTALVAVATIASRVSSGVLNFAFNRWWSFRARGNVPHEALRYAVLFAMQMVLSMSLVIALAWLPLPLTAIKVLVDSVLFVFSYFVQKNWVFAGRAHAEGKGACDEEREQSTGRVDAGCLSNVSQAIPLSVGGTLRNGARGVYGIRAVGRVRHSPRADNRRN